MITKKAKQALPFDMREELMTISQLAPVAPPPDKYLIALYGLMSDWRGSPSSLRRARYREQIGD
jgi:hypothetical protein